MPGRTGGSSGGSHSSSSSSHSSYHSSYRSPYSSGGNGSTNPWSWLITLGVLGVVVFIVLLSRGSTSSNTGSNNASIQATTAADIAIMNKALSNRLSAWQATTDNIVHHIAYQDAGLPANFNTKEVVYGHCTSGQFYLFVLNQDAGTGLSGSADSSGYAYTPASNPSACAPTGWTMTSSENDSGGWYYVNINTKAATAIANLTPSPTP